MKMDILKYKHKILLNFADSKAVARGIEDYQKSLAER